MGRHRGWTVAAMLGLGACGGGGLGVVSGSSATDGASAGSTASGGATGGLTGGGSDGWGTSGGGGSGGPSVDQPDCSGLDCGAHGTCKLDDRGQPVCACDDGWASAGYACLPCPPTAGAVQVEIPVVAIEAEILVAGATPPASEYEDGNVYLRSPTTGDEVWLGNTHDHIVQRTLIPGVYDVYYEKEHGGQLVPSNGSAWLDRITIGDGDRPTIDVPIVPITGTFTVGGKAPPDSSYEVGALELRNPVTGDVVHLGETRAGSFAVNVVPGSYEVHYRWIRGTSIVPRNGDAFVQSIDVYAGGSEVVQNFALDVPVIDVGGQFLLDGQAPPDSTYETGRMSLVEQTSGDVIELGQTRDGSYAVKVVPGSYAFFYDRLFGSSIVPANTHARLETADLAQSTTEDIDISTVHLTGAFTLAGAPAPTSPSDDGLVSLHDPETGDVAMLGNTHDGMYGQIVIPGTYDVYYAQETAGAQVPANTGAKLDTVDVAGPTLDVDIPVVQVSGTISLDGQAPPTSEYDDGRVYLRDPDTGDSVLLGDTRLAAYTRLVVPGTYDVVYVVETAGADVPVNTAAILAQGVAIGGNTDLPIDLSAVALQASLAFTGDVQPPSAGESGLLYVEDQATADRILLGSTASASFDQSLAAGTYLVRYQAQMSGVGLPANTDAEVACFTIAPK